MSYHNTVNKVLLLLVFSVLLLVPVGAQQVFANHPDLACPSPGLLVTPSIDVPTSNRHGDIYCLGGFGFDCPPGYFLDILFPFGLQACTAAQGSFPDLTLEAQCQGDAVLIGNHCVADTTELDACNAALMTCSDELLMCQAPPEPPKHDDDDGGDSDDDD